MATTTVDDTLITRHPCVDRPVHRTVETVPARVCVSGFAITALCRVRVELEPIHARRSEHAECRDCAWEHAGRITA